MVTPLALIQQEKTMKIASKYRKFRVHRGNSYEAFMMNTVNILARVR